MNAFNTFEAEFMLFWLTRSIAGAWTGEFDMDIRGLGVGSTSVEVRGRSWASTSLIRFRHCWAGIKAHPHHFRSLRMTMVFRWALIEEVEKTAVRAQDDSISSLGWHSGVGEGKAERGQRDGEGHTIYLMV